MKLGDDPFTAARKRARNGNGSNRTVECCHRVRIGCGLRRVAHRSRIYILNHQPQRTILRYAQRSVGAYLRATYPGMRGTHSNPCVLELHGDLAARQADVRRRPQERHHRDRIWEECFAPEYRGFAACRAVDRPGCAAWRRSALFISASNT